MWNVGLPRKVARKLAEGKCATVISLPTGTTATFIADATALTPTLATATAIAIATATANATATTTKLATTTATDFTAHGLLHRHRIRPRRPPWGV